ncbi:polysaccharide biosynthesis/export family protein [Rhizobium herbae]|uniref:Polysaccharide biosynthesis/export family protein n=1 Tax=Rhizobium herbae TaxID=508661 RepID=A0ABS7HG56_9HYPH|nr:polysaccharide biosynthesis/export family protein [Rhizobium herbae]MBW9065780.1 polysaccharide biosynthesis/export family protein [Rhizobium herbae]
MNVSSRSYRGPLRAVFIAAAMTVFGGISTAALAESAQLAPQTKIRLTIVQWMPTRGVYEKWDSIGGEFLISDAGTVSLPVIGTLPVGNIDTVALAAQISNELKAKIGLVEPPHVTVQILEHQPVYVVGDVNKPGEYKFHPGLTVLQSLAMSGGEFRPSNGLLGSGDSTGYVGQLREIENSILRTRIRIARLQAEISGEKEMRFDPGSQDDQELAAAILQQEKNILAARLNVVARQSKSFVELRDLLGAEIGVIEKKIDGTDEDIASIKKEVASAKSMVEKGIALPSRQADLERTLRGYHANRLDLVTAIMRARQNIAEATRNLEGLYDKQQTEVATELQSAQAALDQLQLKRDTTQKLLLNALSSGMASGTPGGDRTLAFTVTRRTGETVDEIAASDSTFLQPGDVVRVTRKVTASAQPSPQVTQLPDTRSEQASQ